MIKVIHNSLESGDWVQVWDGDRLLYENHRIEPDDLVDILNSINAGTTIMKEVDDEYFQK